jgi:hypothetical protein
MKDRLPSLANSQSPLTEVHVLQPQKRESPQKKFIWRGFYGSGSKPFIAALRPSTTVTGAVIDLL